ncbi:uncharacterized protein VTP21DRAFT_10685 [Calcarisporiella thermophila]|uniref:uncharacterized protein n=1 Tax=Calcarisporiella thermophila TaxID=911321 RepID=UPI003742EE42
MNCKFRNWRTGTRGRILSYLKDWILVIVLLLGFFAIELVEPFHREFSLKDPDLMHPFAVKERVNLVGLMLISIVAPVVAIFFTSIVIRRSLYDFHNGVLGLLLCITMVVMVTDVLKVSVGRPRPDFIDRCQPLPGSQDPLWALSNATICTQTDSYIIRDGYKSFPSGHSSLSFGGLTFLSLFIAGKLHVFDQRGHTFKGFVVVLPMIGAALVAISRIEDYRHHPTDIIAGAIIGVLAAYFSYRQYYPSLTSPDCHKPFSPRLRDSIHPLTADYDLNGDETDVEAAHHEELPSSSISDISRPITFTEDTQAHQDYRKYDSGHLTIPIRIEIPRLPDEQSSADKRFEKLPASDSDNEEGRY